MVSAAGTLKGPGLHRWLLAWKFPVATGGGREGGKEVRRKGGVSFAELRDGCSSSVSMQQEPNACHVHRVRLF